MYVRITDLNQQSKILGFKEFGYKINNSPGAVSPKPGSDKGKPGPPFYHVGKQGHRRRAHTR